MMQPNILDYIDFEKVNLLLEGFNQSTGFVTGILDLEGNILSKSGWRQMCTEFHRMNPETSKKCTISDTVLAGKMKKGVNYHAYQCLNGLVDVAVPLVIKGEHVANLFSGQFFFEKPDIAFFKNQAAKYGFNESWYLKALEKVPVVSEDRVKIVMNFLLNLVQMISDMTLQRLELLEMNETLQKSEEKFRTIFENSPIGIAMTTMDGKLFTNSAYCNILGYSEEELQHLSWQEFTHPDDVANDNKIIATLISGEKTKARWEKRYIHKSGRVVWADINSLVQRDHSGKPLYYNISIIDITDRKQFENELANEKQRLLSILEGTNVGTWEWNIQTGETIFNERWAEIKGYTLNEISPVSIATWEKLSHPEDLKTAKELLAKHFKGELDYYECETRMKHKNGDWIWVLDRGRVYQWNTNGQPVLMAGTHQDITERKKYIDNLKIAKEKAEEDERELKHSHDLMQYIIEHNSSAVAVHDKNFRYIYVSKKYLQDYQVKEKDILGKHHYDVFPDLPQKWRDIHKKALAGEVSSAEDDPYYKEDGTIEWTRWECRPWYEKDNSIGGFVVYTEIITERKNLELKLKAAKEKAEESDRLKSAFLANMSHEIRTPMNGILGFTDLLLNPDLNSDEKENFIRIIHQSGQRMLNTVNDIVEISKIEAGMVNVVKKDTDITERLDELTHFFRAEAEKKGLKLILEMLLPTEKKRILTDQNKLDSILTNLIKNAIKYTASGTIKVGCLLKGAEVEFYVKDTGIGIPANRWEAIFNRFEQADIADTRAFEGSGLGLAISKSYAEMLGGRIWVESEEGKGSTFYFIIPSQGSHQQKNSIENAVSNATKTLANPKTRGLKILIAEDDKSSEMLLEIVIKPYSKEILKADTGTETVEVCRNNPDIDLIFMDIQMAGFNGYEATRKIREFNKEVVIIAQTSFALSGDREKALEAGCNDYISKPIKKEHLTGLIEKYFADTMKA